MSPNGRIKFIHKEATNAPNTAADSNRDEPLRKTVYQSTTSETNQSDLATAEEKQKQLLSPPEHLPLLPQYERLFSTNQTQVDEDVNDRASKNDEVGPFTP